MSRGFLKITAQYSKRMEAVVKNNERLVNAAAKSVMEKHGAEIEKETKQALSIGGYGPLRKAKRAGGRAKVRDYTPSRQGQPPHLKTGALRASIGFIIRVGKSVSMVVGSVRSGTGKDKSTGRPNQFKEGVKYSKWLEEKLMRPYLTPIVKKHIPIITADLRHAINKILGGK